LFAAIACVSGTMSGHTWDNRNSSKPIPIMHVHGLNDQMVPIDGSISSLGGWGGAPNIDLVMDFWTGLNSCTSTDSLIISPNTNAIHYHDPMNANNVWYYKIENYGHKWPNGINDRSGIKDNSGFNASEEIWRFFSKY